MGAFAFGAYKSFSSGVCQTKLRFIFQFPVISGVARRLLDQLRDLRRCPRSLAPKQM